MPNGRPGRGGSTNIATTGRRTSGVRRIDPEETTQFDPPKNERFQNDALADVFCYGKGRKYGSFITGRTATLTTSSLNENPAYIIESIFRELLGLQDADIDNAAFDAVGGDSGLRDHTAWKFARSLNQADDSLSVIHSICESAGVVLVESAAGKERLVALDSYEQQADLRDSDLATENGKPLIRVRQTPVGNIRNEFYLNYCYDYGKGSFTKQRYVTADATNMASDTRANDDGSGAAYTTLCDTSQTLYNKVDRLMVDSMWIRSETVADLYLKWLANWLAIRRWECSATVMYNEKTLKLELMDSVRAGFSLVPSSVRSNNTFFVTGLTDGGLARPFRIDLELSACPFFFMAAQGGYGFNYGETGYGNVQL